VSSPSGDRPRRFAEPLRPAAEQVSKQHAFRSNQQFEPLPPPTGPYPYRLPLESVLEAQVVSAIEQSGRLTFHCAGDTGGVRYGVPQQIVAYWMGQDLVATGADVPAFFYHLGDVVYYNGQHADYYPQFYEPYEQYAAPIVAIPGNHDGDPLDATVEPSLSAFVDLFCAQTPHLAPEAQESQRDTMTQPNPYWTLTSSLVTIVGLYTNVPEGGRLDNDQIGWLQAELAAAPTDRALLVALHHPIYSADAHHGGSQSMGRALDAAVAATGRVPDAVLTGHVHNYQRFTRTVQGRAVPYIVAGAGGYWHLHYMAKDANGQNLPVPWQTPDPDVQLEAYSDDRHGYLRLTVSATALSGQYVTVPRPQESWRNGPVTVIDSFTLDLTTHALG
jgi:hypothetical protein